MILLVLTYLVAVASPASAADLVGRASMDGDTIELHGTRIRLYGIDAPESAQLCRDSQGKEYRCGQTSANALADLSTASRSPVIRGPDQYGGTVAVCAVSGVDLGDWLVRRGLAVDYAHYSKGKYRAAQDEASKAHIGVWSGDFIEPRYFRSCLKGGRLPPDCSSS